MLHGFVIAAAADLYDRLDPCCANDPVVAAKALAENLAAAVSAELLAT